jgi:hypothetical protein
MEILEQKGFAKLALWLYLRRLALAGSHTLMEKQSVGGSTLICVNCMV